MRKRESAVSRCNTKPEPVQNHLRNQVVPDSLTAPLGAEGSEPATTVKRNGRERADLSKAIAKMVEGQRKAAIAREQAEQRAAEERRQAEQVHAALEAIRIYRDEKAQSELRNAPAKAEHDQRCRDAVARADVEAEQIRRGGRPKGKAKHGPNITISRRNPLDIGRNDQPW